MTDPRRQQWSASSYDTHARFVSDLRCEHVPQPVRERVKDIVLDALERAARTGEHCSE